MKQTAQLALIPALVGSLTLLWIGFQNNNQGEFYEVESGLVDWNYCGLILTRSFLILFASSFAIIAVLRSFIHRR